MFLVFVVKYVWELMRLQYLKKKSAKKHMNDFRQAVVNFFY